MITASIVTYKTNKEELTTVLLCTCSSSVEKVYIVDNSPTDVLKTFAQFSPKIEYIFGQGNVGYGAAHNIAICKSIEVGAMSHVVINPDIQFGDGVIEEVASYMEKNPDIGQVMPRVIYPDGELQYLCKLLPTPMDLIGRRFLSSYDSSKFEMRASGYDKIMEVPFLSGCFMVLRVEALAKVNGFSDRYWMYCEDIDLCRKIGVYYRTVYYPFCTVIHAHKKESYKNKKILIEHIKSAIKYFNKWGWMIDMHRYKKNKAAESQFCKNGK